MSDATTTQNAAAAIERAKEVADRYNRQAGYLVAMHTRLPILEGALKHAQKIHRESGEDVARLTKEVDACTKHIAQLEIWTATHAQMPDDIEAANNLAAKIKRLLKDIEKRKEELHRLEAGLPSAGDGLPQ